MALSRRRGGRRAPLPKVTLATIPCQACGATGAKVVLVGRGDQDPVGQAWCGVECARGDGWPWIAAKPRGGLRAAGLRVGQGAT